MAIELLKNTPTDIPLFIAVMRCVKCGTEIRRAKMPCSEEQKEVVLLAGLPALMKCPQKCTPAGGILETGVEIVWEDFDRKSVETEES